MRSSVQIFKTSFWHLFVSRCDDGLNNLELHLLDRLVDHLNLFSSFCYKCFCLRVSRFSNRAVLYKYSQTFENTNSGHCPKLGHCLVQTIFSTIYDNPNTNRITSSRLGIVRYGETIALRALLEFQNNKNNHG